MKLLISWFSLVGMSIQICLRTSAFLVPGQRHILHKSNLCLSSTPPLPDPERMRQIMEEESKNPANLKASAEMLKNLKPEDLDSMLREMDSMPESQKQQLKAMGMNPDIMRQSMEMMKANPQMAKQMANMMETMTPQEMMDKSRQAQAQFEVASSATSKMPVMDAQLEKEDQTEPELENETESEPIPPPEKEILDTLYRTAEIMSDPPTGKVTFAGFASIPPIALLIGNDSERDLSKSELKECWADGSLGSTRVDRIGFERVWVEVQEYFSLPLLDKARERTLPKKRGVVETSSSKPSSSAAATKTVSSSSASSPLVGQTVPEDVLEKQMKNMSDMDMDLMLQQMQNMTPEQEARMKAMGVDPTMMKKTASLMNSNPLMKGAAKMMMKNMSADQMKKASQQAQEQMSKMSPDEIQKAYDELDRRANSK